MVHSHPGSDKTTEETEMYFLSNLHKELISKKVLRDKQTENSTIKQTSLLIWRKHEKQPNQMACGQQQTTVKTTTCSACSKPTSDVRIIYIGSESEKDTTKLKIWLVFEPWYLCSALLQWAENHRLLQVKPDAPNSTRHWQSCLSELYKVRKWVELKWQVSCKRNNTWQVRWSQWWGH